LNFDRCGIGFSIESPYPVETLMPWHSLLRDVAAMPMVSLLPYCILQDIDPRYKKGGVVTVILLGESLHGCKSKDFVFISFGC